MAIENFLQQMADDISAESAEHIYSFQSKEPPNLRCPNEKEKRQWMKDELRRIYFWGNNDMPIATYRTLQGHIRRGQYAVVFKCLVNKRYCTEEELKNIMSRFEKYSNSKVIQTVSVSITFPEPVKLTTIDVRVMKNE